MVVSINRVIELYEQAAKVDENKAITVLRPDIRLPCLVTAGECQTNIATYLWSTDNQDKWCPYYFIRNVTGIVITDEVGIDVFISNDGSMVRLVLIETLFQYDSKLISTNYDTLFLSQEKNHQFGRPLHPSEVNTITYAKQADRYMFGYLTTYIRKELYLVNYHTCRREIPQYQLRFKGKISEQHSNVDGHIASLGNGYFVVVSGEVWHKYRCRAIIVRPRQTHLCFASLPVTLTPSDKERYNDFSQNHTGSEREFYVQPHTRILTNRGIELPCVLMFAAIYKTITGAWIQLKPEISFIETPKTLTQEYGI